VLGEAQPKASRANKRNEVRGLYQYMNELQTILAETCTRLFTDHATTLVLEGAERDSGPRHLAGVEEKGPQAPQVPEGPAGGAGGS